jgi:hypothetical protein
VIFTLVVEKYEKFIVRILIFHRFIKVFLFCIFVGLYDINTGDIWGPHHHHPFPIIFIISLTTIQHTYHLFHQKSTSIHMHLNICKARDMSRKIGGQKTRWGATRPYPWTAGHPLLFFKTPSSPFTPHLLTKLKNIEPPHVSNSKFWVSFFQDLSRVWKKKSWVMSWVSSSASSFEKSLVQVFLIC